MPRAKNVSWLVTNLDRPRGLALRMPAAEARRMHQQYGQFCPVAMASEVLAERWTLIILRELLAGSRRFNQIRRGVPRLSPTLLKQRLQTLEKAGIVERQPCGWRVRLSTHAGWPRSAIGGAFGRGVGAALVARHRATGSRPRPVDVGNAPAPEYTGDAGGRTVIAIEFLDSRISHRRFWLVHLDGEVQVCLKDPGYDTTVYVSTHLRVLVEVWRGSAPSTMNCTPARSPFRIPSLCRDFPKLAAVESLRVDQAAAGRFVAGSVVAGFSERARHNAFPM